MKRLLPALLVLLAACDSSEPDVDGSLAVSAVEPIACTWDGERAAFACTTAVLVTIENPGGAKRLVVAIDSDSLGAPVSTAVDIGGDAAGEHRVVLPNAPSSRCQPGLGLARAVAARLESAPGEVVAETSRWNLEVEVSCD